MPHASRKHSGFRRVWRSLPVGNGRLALALLLLAILLSALESAYVQVVTTYQTVSPKLLRDPAFLLLFSLDLLVPTAVAMLSRRVFMLYLVGQCFMSAILLHYNVFFYNPLTLSTIYHSWQGAASLGIDIFAFAKPWVILRLVLLLAVKILLVQLSLAEDERMPRLWRLRGIIAVCCLALICAVYTGIYGRTGLSSVWVDLDGHRSATERRMEAGTLEAVRNIGYAATWLGELATGKYKDTELIYAQARCADPEGNPTSRADGPVCPNSWLGLPLPPAGPVIVLMQVESLDYAALNLKVNGREVLPFLDKLAAESLVLKVFAPHKVGSSNSDYEILNARLADQNVIYYGYIKEYPDSVAHILADKGYRPAVLHGLPGRLFNLREAYAAQGFKDMFFKEELIKAGYAPSRMIMEHIPDAELFAFAAERDARLDPDAPRAEFLITMSSHVPFMDPLPAFKSAGGPFSRYISSMHYFDEHFAAYYAGLPAGTLLILWGDHGSDVEYPEPYGPNSRHVPFIVHVKGNEAWLEGRAGARPGVYTLCELSYYIRKIFKAARP